MHFRAHFHCLNLGLFSIFFGYIYDMKLGIHKTLKIHWQWQQESQILFGL